MDMQKLQTLGAGPSVMILMIKEQQMIDGVVMKTQHSDPVNRPAHYLAASVMIEPIELTARLDSCLGQAIQYVLRAPYKNNEREDLKKAVYYLCKRVDLIKYSATQMTCTFDGEVAGFIRAFQEGVEDDLAAEVMDALFDCSRSGFYVSGADNATAAIEIIQAKLDSLRLKDVEAMK